MVKFLSSNQITASHYHRKDHRVCKINVVNRISSLESGVCCQTSSALQFWYQCTMWYSQYLEKEPACKFLDVESSYYCFHTWEYLKAFMPLISKCKSTGKDWEDAKTHIFQVLCASMYITMSKLENSMPDARPRHDKDSANIKWRMVFK